MNSGQRPYIYVVLGVHSHYTLAKIAKGEVQYYDSMNISLRDVWNGTEECMSQDERECKDYKDKKLHMHNLR